MVDIDGDKRSKYTYSGPRRDPKNSYVLIFDQTKQTCTLERLSSSFDLNLESTPVEDSAPKLQERYPHIPPLIEPTEDPSNLFDDDAEPDPDNPFDYRHFLKVALKEHPPSVLSRSPSPLPQTQNTPRLNPSSQYMSSPKVVARSPALAPGSPLAPSRSPIPRRSGAPGKSDILRPMNAKKRRIQDITPAESSPTPPLNPAKETAEKPKPAMQKDKKVTQLTPSVRLDRRAGTRPNAPKSAEFVHSSSSSPDDGAGAGAAAVSSPQIFSPAVPPTSHLTHTIQSVPDETITLDYSPANPAHRRMLGAALAAHSSTGPISLRSAAASPDSRVHSPLQVSRRREEGPEEIDFGDTDIGEGDDGDVVPMRLGSPVVGVRDAEGEGEEDDFEAELMQGLVGEDEGGENMVLMEDESDVSEAE